MRFKIIRELGRGGFGIVDEVEDEAGGRFARKRFSPAMYVPPSAVNRLRKRFKREVLTQAELGGNEILPVIASDLDCSEPWFVMPLATKTYETQIVEE